MTRTAKITLSSLVGVSAGAAIGLAMAGSYDDKPLWLVVLAYALACGPALAAGFYYFVLERRALEEADRAARHNVERAWAERAGSAAWAATVTILIALSLAGQATGTRWLEHLGTAHVAIVGMGSFAISYAVIKRREA